MISRHTIFAGCSCTQDAVYTVAATRCVRIDAGRLLIHACNLLNCGTRGMVTFEDGLWNTVHLILESALYSSASIHSYMRLYHFYYRVEFDD